MKSSWREAVALLTAPFDLPERNLVLARSPEEIANAISEKHGDDLHLPTWVKKLEQQLKIAKDRKVPLLLDDARPVFLPWKMQSSTPGWELTCIAFPEARAFAGRNAAVCSWVMARILSKPLSSMAARAKAPFAAP